MTAIKPDKPVLRETGCVEGGHALTVTLYPRTLTLRMKGGRRSWSVPYDTLLWHLVRVEAAAKERERKERRRGQLERVGKRARKLARA